jgi:signal transduction histidine kinase
MNEMKVFKSYGGTDDHFCRETDRMEINSETDMLKAIENADGVPYHMIFGARRGDGVYLQIGQGITQLIGVAPGDLDEKLFNSMIEEFIPLSNDIPADPIISRDKFINGIFNNYKVEIFVKTATGEKKWIRDTALPVIDEESGKVIGSYGILFDITDRKRSLVQLEKVHEMVKEEDRLKSSFLQNISHEIRTPLNAIVGFSTLLSEPEYDNEKRQEFLDMLTRSADQFLELINNIVEISRIESGDISVLNKKTNLNSVFNKVYERLRPLANDKNITLNIALPSGESDLIILTDEIKLLQILMNIGDNAIKFTSEGVVELGFRIIDSKIEFYISDTGIGISAENNNKIFRSFYQADSSTTRKYEGAGLGLSIAKAYVKMLGGEIWYTSKPGEGSVFYFTLPRLL